MTVHRDNDGYSLVNIRYKEEEEIEMVIQGKDL